MSEKVETLDFVKDFQEYLTQQTQHVNMISGSVGGEKDAEMLQGGLQANPPGVQPEVGPGYGGDGASVECRPVFGLPGAGTEGDQNGLDHPSAEVALDDSFERTYEGKLKCRYCDYASKGTARLIEHIRIHTGEKPHRCHLCPFASAYERHLEAHMRSHTGEKPYTCELCSFRCSDRSNLSHHRRRRHKIPPLRGPRSALAGRKSLSELQRKSASLGHGRRLLLGYGPPPAQRADFLSDFARQEPPLLRREAYDGVAELCGARERGDAEAEEGNPLARLSSLAGGQPVVREPASPESGRDEKPFLIPPPSASSPASPGPRSEHSARTSTPSVSNSPPSTPAPAGTIHNHDPRPLHHCQHCDTYFPDNVLYTIHMGCHGYEKPFQCNVCGCECRNRYDFACHFARGQHK